MATETRKVKVLIDTIDKVRNFVNIMSQFSGDFDLVSGRYVVNAQSILGLFSLDLLEPLTLMLETTPQTMEEVLEAIKAYIVKD